MAEKAARPHAASTPPVQVLELPCPSCGERLRHRVLHVKGGTGSAGGGHPGVLEGIARCSKCHSAHPFFLEPRTLHPVAVIMSEGPQSLRSVVELPPDRWLELDGTLRVEGRPVRISRIEGPEGRNLYRARPRSIVSLWTVPTDELHLRLSVVEGPRTRPLHLKVKGDAVLRVGDDVRIEGERIEIIGIRAKGKTHHEIGESFPAREVQRLYGRTARTPPGGRSAWSRSREMPRS